MAKKDTEEAEQYEGRIVRSDKLPKGIRRMYLCIEKGFAHTINEVKTGAITQGVHVCFDTKSSAIICGQWAKIDKGLCYDPKDIKLVTLKELEAEGKAKMKTISANDVVAPEKKKA